MSGLYLFESDSFDPYHNLAIEEALMVAAEDSVVLYLWQNRNTVVIGKNQNPWKECRTALLEQEGGHLARRLSGGGAVFHDLGNLNFTILVPQTCFDIPKQQQVILSAVRSLGISAELSGRNDILCHGRKFSGNAFYKNGKAAYHHGTLLVDVDQEKLSRYLSPSKAKLQSKGVDSVRSRVVNLKELDPAITTDALKEALIRSMAQVYGLEPERLTDPDLNTSRIEALTRRNQSWEWLYGQRLPFTMEREERFPWGSLQLQLQIENGIIRQAKAYSDAMDWTLVPELETRLTGCRFEVHALARQLQGLSAAEEISQMLCHV